ncbi:MAG: disulfide bond formation protein B [Alphaproteobacteria bacterium]|nr:disulfide bond formation protein B [Alphaproteobacteria bacterium]
MLFPISSTAALRSVTIISALALLAAYASEYIGGLEPCILCLYQRIPFAIVILLGLLGYINPRLAVPFLGLAALAFVTNAGIASYHTGVELKWWESGVEGCKVPVMDTSQPDWVERMLSAPAVPCTAIQWKDPVLGLTMANYNVFLNLALFLYCAAALMRSRAR